MNWPWSELGLPGPSDPETVRHAYAQRLKTAHPEEDPESFQRLHEAYQLARRLARQAPRAQVPVQEPEETEPPEGPEEENPDFSELLGGQPEESAPKGGEKEQFDFERLFAERDQELRQARERQVRERLRAAQERRKRAGYQDAALESEEAVNAALTALWGLDILWERGASPEEWNGFLHGSVFLDVQHNLDFVFGLEDFLLRYPDMPEELKRKIFLVYKFYNGKPKAAYMGLYRLLLSSYTGAGAAAMKRRVRKEKGKKAAPYLVVLGLFLIAFGLSVGGTIRERSTVSSRPSTGSADAAYSSSSSSTGAVVWSTLEVPDTHDRQGEIDNDVPLEGGNKTSFFGMVVSYAAADYPGLYATSGRGTAENSEEIFQWMQVTGQDKHMDELVMNYYLSADKKSFYCIPDGYGGETVDVICTHAWGGISIYKYAH